MKRRKMLQSWKDYLEETIQAFNEPAKIVQKASNWYHLLDSSCEICYGSSIAGKFIQVLVDCFMHFVLSHDLKLPTIILPALYLLPKKGT